MIALKCTNCAGAGTEKSQAFTTGEKVERSKTLLFTRNNMVTRCIRCAGRIKRPGALVAPIDRRE